ncbi:MAG: alkaline phosphatase family protein [Candidatus Baltobacteraceae bacterium]
MRGMQLRAACALACFTSWCSLGGPASAAAVPRPAHAVVIVEENHTFAQIVGNPDAPFLNSLARQGAVFSDAHGVTHPSLPNYFALFAGRTNDNGDGCPATGISANAPNLASELLAAHLTFNGYAESLPERGWTGCWAGKYARKHVPWVHFSNVPRELSLPFSDFPQYDRLPTVSFVIPDVDDDMHDGTVKEADEWLAKRLGPLFAWARRNDTLVVLTWDEGYDDPNDIPTIFVGPMVKPGRYSERIDHYRVLRTLEDAYHLAPTGKAARVAPIADCWR